MKTKEILSQLDACWLPNGQLREAESLLRMHPRDAWASLLRRRPPDAVWLWERLGLGKFPVRCAREVAARATAWLAAEAGLKGFASAIMEALESGKPEAVRWTLHDVWGEAPSCTPFERCALVGLLALDSSSAGCLLLDAEKALGFCLLGDLSVDSEAAVTKGRESGLVFQLVYDATVDVAVEGWRKWLASTGCTL